MEAAAGAVAEDEEARKKKAENLSLLALWGQASSLMAKAEVAAMT